MLLSSSVCVFICIYFGVGCMLLDGEVYRDSVETLVLGDFRLL